MASALTCGNADCHAQPVPSLAIEKLRRLSDAATPGPWTTFDGATVYDFRFAIAAVNAVRAALAGDQT